MKKILAIAVMVLTISSCAKERLYVYTYHWSDAPQSSWSSYNLIFEERLSDGAIEVYRQTEDNKVIERGQTSTGVVWSSYITYAGCVE